jgi:signal transduction histidine kinase
MNQLSEKMPDSDGTVPARALLLAQDWSSSPLGPPDNWPQELVTVVNLLLDSRFPMFVAWGPELAFLYNDEYAKVMGDKHPAGFGRPFSEVWAEIWPTITPIVADALAGKSSYFEDLPLMVLRKGYLEQAWFTFSYSPMRDSTGSACGIYCAVVETSARVLSEKRQAFQLELADRLRPLLFPEEIIHTASNLLGGHLGVSRVYYSEIDDERNTFHVLGKWQDGDMPALPGNGRMDDYGAMLLSSLRLGSPFVVDDVEADARVAATREAYAALHIRALLVIPLVKSGRLAITLNLTKPAPYRWTAQDILDAKDMAERTWSAAEKAQAQAELREADRRKDEFLAMLAHELRNPLAPISAAAELIGMAQFDPSRLKQTSQIIIRQVSHMTGLVDDLLDVSRVTRGLVSISKSEQDVKNIVANAVEQVRPAMEARRHHLLIDLAPESVQVLGDQKRLVQILTNLLNNAAKYTPPGGHISVRMRSSTDEVELTVEDNGIGIAPDLQMRVFDLFAQGERTSDRSQGGLGLGLALVKSLVALHDGTVTCASEGIDKGSRFSVRLPRLAARPSAPEHPPSSALRRASKGLRLMVVDDNEDAARMLAMLLEALGHQVLVEHDPFRALERARVERPEVFLLDIGLPGMDGNELASRLRAQAETAQAKLIAVTGYGQARDRSRALAAGFKHYLAKPVDMPKLTGLLADIGNA